MLWLVISQIWTTVYPPFTVMSLSLKQKSYRITHYKICGTYFAESSANVGANDTHCGDHAA